MKYLGFVALVAALLIVSSAAMAAATSFVFGGFTPNPAQVKVVGDVIPSLEMVRSTATGTGSFTEYRFGFAETLKQFNQDQSVQKYSVGIDKLFSVGNPDAVIKFKLGVGVGAFRVLDTKTVTNNVGYYGVARLNLTKAVFVEAKYTDVRKTTTGDGWNVGLGLSF